MREVLKEYNMSWEDILQIVIGSFLLSLAFQVFLLPNEIISGGVSSLSIIIYEVTGIQPALIQYAFNIPLLVLSFMLLGRDVGFKSIVGSLVYPFFTGVVSGLPPLTEDLLLASVFGGALVGVGVGLVFRGKGSTGGTSTVAQIISKYVKMSLGNATLLADAVIIIIGFIVFDLQAVMYGIIALVIASRVIDIVLVGTSTQKTVFIISEKTKDIQLEILGNFNRGVTLFDARGGYQNQPKEVMMVIIEEREITDLRDMIVRHDENAFVVVMAASEVMGRGFTFEKIGWQKIKVEE